MRDIADLVEVLLGDPGGPFCTEMARSDRIADVSTFDEYTFDELLVLGGGWSVRGD